MNNFNNVTCTWIRTPLSALPSFANIKPDITTPVFVWSILEGSLSVVCVCLPTLRPLIASRRAGTSRNASTVHFTPKMSMTNSRALPDQIALDGRARQLSSDESSMAELKTTIEGRNNSSSDQGGDDLESGIWLQRDISITDNGGSWN